MHNLDYKPFTERHRPHFHPPGAVLFVTYRLAGSIPKSTVREYKARKQWLEDQVNRVRRLTQINGTAELTKWHDRVETFKREWFVKFEKILHQDRFGPVWMKDERVAKKVAESLKELDNTAYRLDAYSVMSNHVHAVFKPFLSENNLLVTRGEDGHEVLTSEYPGLSRITHSIKGRSARECNLILSRSGSFWEQESFDHVIRPGKFESTVRYVLDNPVKAGLVRQWRQWPWNYCRQELSDRF